MFEDQQEPLNLLQQPDISEELERRVTQLCSLKRALDQHVQQQMGPAFCGDWMDDLRDSTCAYTGHEFLWPLLPFMSWEDDPPQKSYRAYVSPRHVLGANIKGYPEHIAPDKVAERIERYATYFGSDSNALYVRYPALGLFYAHEGKHRVAFMHAHNQPAIAAWVRDQAYPSADRIVMVSPADARNLWMAVLDGRYLQVLRRPKVTRALLTAYGVRTVRWKDMEGWPDEELVRKAVLARSLHRPGRTYSESERTLDFECVHQEQQDCMTMKYGSVADIAPLALDRSQLVRIVTTCLVLGGAFALGPGWMHDAGLLLSGCAIGLVSSLSVLRFVGPKSSWPNP